MPLFKKAAEAANRVIYANAAEKNKFASNEITNTKYTWYNFIPKNLWEQFSRAMNRYFLLIACLQLIRTITPVNPLTTWLPLAVIFGVTAVKEGVDDWGRAKADAIANSRTYTVVREGKEVEVASKDIRVGDILKLVDNDEVPCDAVILASSDANGNCFIQTTNLDGESNLKVRSALAATKKLNSPAAIAEWKGSVECAAPNEHIYSFDSQLKASETSQVLPLSSSQLLLQATHLRNTDWVYGLVVYSGNETKFGKNKKTPPTKYTRTDAFINNVSASIFGFQLLLVVIFGIVGDTFTDSYTRGWWYMAYTGDYPAYNQIIIPARFLLLNSTMIPISLKLTIDLCKLFYAKFIDADLHLYEPSTDMPAHSNSTALSEDLGQIKYVLTDKTGTLTENRMVLKTVNVLGTQYGDDEGSLNHDVTLMGTPLPSPVVDTTLPPSLQAAAATGIMADMKLYNATVKDSQAGVTTASGLEFFRNLALNNDVVPGTSADGTHKVYKASSPDEESLVKSAAAYGVSLWERVGDDVTIQVFGKTEVYTQLAAFEFTSDRKRMSVLLKNKATGAIRLYTKGADDMVMARLAAGQEALKTTVQAAVDKYAAQGLRTLVYGHRDVSEAEYAAWKSSYDVAAAAMVDREGAKEKVYAQMEVGFLLVAATAIEDKLQDGVPATIGLLKQAGVSFWMLTGDKFSTALTIAHTCNLKPKANDLITLEGEDPASVKASVDKAYQELTAAGHKLSYEVEPTGFAAHCKRSGSKGGKKPLSSTPTGYGATGADKEMTAVVNVDGKPAYSVIVRGATLEVALRECKERFAAVCTGADSVICCRVTPKQKGQLVRLVKEAGHLTLAIGDGGNDVAMIQEAAVGVGIRGKEGLQAARAADYQVSFFRALQRLLLVHGRYSYYRTAVVAQYSFYKSFLFCVMQIGYGFFSGYAGVSLFNSLCVAAYNAVLFVPIVYFLVDRDIVQSTALSQPQAYLMCSDGTLMTRKTMLSWFARGLWQAVVLLLFGLYGGAFSKSGDYESMGLAIFMAYMWTQDFTMLFALRRVTWYNIISVFGMHLLAFIVGLIANNVIRMRSFIDYYSFTNTIKDPYFWLYHLLVTAVCVLPVQVVEWWNFAFTNSFENELYRLDRKNEAIEMAARKAGTHVDLGSSENGSAPLLGGGAKAPNGGAGTSVTSGSASAAAPKAAESEATRASGADVGKKAANGFRSFSGIPNSAVAVQNPMSR